MTRVTAVKVSADRPAFNEEIESVKKQIRHLITSLKIGKRSHTFFGVAQFFMRILYTRVLAVLLGGMLSSLGLLGWGGVLMMLAKMDNLAVGLYFRR